PFADALAGNTQGFRQLLLGEIAMGSEIGEIVGKGHRGLSSLWIWWLYCTVAPAATQPISCCAGRNLCQVSVAGRSFAENQNLSRRCTLPAQDPLQAAGVQQVHRLEAPPVEDR